MKELTHLFKNPNPQQIPFFEVTPRWCDFYGVGLTIRGSLDEEKNWPQGEFERARSFKFLVTNYDRTHYLPGDRIFVTPIRVQGRPLTMKELQTTIEAPEECAKRLEAWLKELAERVPA